VLWLGGEIMANMKNAEKRILVNAKKNIRNNNYSASMKTAVKNVEKAVLAKDKTVAEDALKVAIKKIDKAAGANVVAKNKCAREKSRLTKKVNAMN
jgi:small subunit ribosomal protein S20